MSPPLPMGLARTAQERTEEISQQVISSVLLEEQEKARLTASIGLKFPRLEELTSKLGREIEKSRRAEAKGELSRSRSVTRKFQLAAEPTDPSTLHVKSRTYEQAPVYKELRVFRRMECGCCHTSDILAITLLELTASTSTRQVEYLSDGTIKTVSTVLTQ